MGWPTIDDTKFVEILLDGFEEDGNAPDRYFFSKISGVTHRNLDGSNRVHCMYGCEIGHRLDLRHEATNPADPLAVAVHRADNGKQLGYLPADTAHELLRRQRVEGGQWIAVFKEPYLDENGQSVVGATIFVMHFPAAEQS